VLDDPERVADVVGVLLANRRAARGDATEVTLLQLGPGGELEGVDGAPAAGVPALLAARELLVVATGSDRAAALRAMLRATPSAEAPASLLRDHPRLTVIADRAAVALLLPMPGWDSGTVVVVLGHREPGISAEHRISQESGARLRRAARFVRSHPVRAVILSGYSATGGLSEAEQMKQTWPESLVPALLEVAGRTTAENASRSLPIVLALGGIGRVVVVSSTWHVRVPYFFAPYRRFGLRVGFRSTVLHGNWARMVREELRGLPHARRQRRAAMGGVEGRWPRV
jgi:uncharacterized SAM-binding protein YcdF (DUF218 family)